MTPTRSLAVVVATTVLAGMTLVCETVLVITGHVDGDSFAGVLTTLIVPAIMILLGAQASQTKANVAEVSAKVDRVLNGEMERKIADVIAQVVPGILRDHGLIESARGPADPPPDPWATQPLPAPRQPAHRYHPQDYPFPPAPAGRRYG